MAMADPGYPLVKYDFYVCSGLTTSGDATVPARYADGPAAVVLGHQGRSALIGFTADAIVGQGNGQRFFENLLDITAAPPVIQPLAVQQPSCAAAVNASTAVQVRVTDRHGDLLTVWPDWGDSPAVHGRPFAEPTGEYAGTFTHAYSSTGLYPITVSAEDTRGLAASLKVPCLLAVYDPADAAKGSGWVDSPPGAYKADPSLAGRATFGERRSRALARRVAAARAAPSTPHTS
jgi:hypothetical protein